MQFSDIIGQVDAKATLVNAVRFNKVAHAQLFAGMAGGAALPLALAYAALLNCTNRQDNDSCGICPSCHKTARLVHPDMHIYFPVALPKGATGLKSVSETFMKDFRAFILDNPYSDAKRWSDALGIEKQLNISVEDTRGIISSVSYQAYEGGYKIMLLWLPEYMNIEATNAILKVLEEPTDKTIFLLVSNGIGQLLPTVLSRCQIIKVAQYTDAEVVTYLVDKEGVTASEASVAARLAEGNIPEAILMLENQTSSFFELFARWMRACFSNKLKEITLQSEEFNALGREEQKNFMRYGTVMLRESLLYRVGGEGLVKLAQNEFEFLAKFSQSLNFTNIESIFGELNAACAHLRRNANPKICFTYTSLKIHLHLHQA